MNPPWRESIRLTQPLREARLLGPAPHPQLEALLRECERAGYDKGRQDGERSFGEQMLQQRTELLALQTGLFQSLRVTLPAVAQDCEQALIQLALEVARKIVADVPIDATMVENAIREAVAHLQDASEYQVLLHPDDHQLLQRTNSPVLLEAAAGEKVRIQPSSEVTRGGCVIHTRFGTVDARREAKMDMLRKSILA